MIRSDTAANGFAATTRAVFTAGDGNAMARLAPSRSVFYDDRVIWIDRFHKSNMKSRAGSICLPVLAREVHSVTRELLFVKIFIPR